jgi:hypothetical protein
LRVPGGDRFGHAGDLGDRPDHATHDDERADGCQQHRKAAKHAEQQCGAVDTRVDLCIELLGAFGVVPAERVKIVSEFIMSVGGEVLVRTAARRLRPRFSGYARELGREILEGRQAN